MLNYGCFCSESQVRESWTASTALIAFKAGLSTSIDDIMLHLPGLLTDYFRTYMESNAEVWIQSSQNFLHIYYTAAFQPEWYMKSIFEYCFIQHFSCVPYCLIPCFMYAFLPSSFFRTFVWQSFLMLFLRHKPVSLTSCNYVISGLLRHSTTSSICYEMTRRRFYS